MKTGNYCLEGLQRSRSSSIVLSPFTPLDGAPGALSWSSLDKTHHSLGLDLLTKSKGHLISVEATNTPETPVSAKLSHGC